MAPKNTRHLPNLEMAHECTRLAVKAAKDNEPDTVDQCVTAALQYLQPDVEHVKTDKPPTQYRVNVAQVGDGDTDPSQSRPMDAAEADSLVRRIAAVVDAQKGVIELPLSHDRLPVHMAAVHIAAWWITTHTDKPY